MNQRTVLRAVLMLFGLVTIPAVATAEFIGPNQFGGSKVIENFDSAGQERSVEGPLTLGDITIRTGSGIIRILDYFEGGPSSSERCFLNQGTCLGTGLEDLESIWVDLAVPVNQAGLWVGLTSDAFSASVSFFSGDVLLESRAVSGGGYQFAGWYEPSAYITSIRVDDTALNHRITLIDNLTYEQVPEPSTALLLSAGLGTLTLVRRRRARWA
jgi:hypothetical protein